MLPKGAQLLQGDTDMAKQKGHVWSVVGKPKMDKKMQRCDQSNPSDVTWKGKDTATSRPHAHRQPGRGRWYINTWVWQRRERETKKKKYTHMKTRNTCGWKIPDRDSFFTSIHFERSSWKKKKKTSKRRCGQRSSAEKTGKQRCSIGQVTEIKGNLLHHSVGAGMLASLRLTAKQEQPFLYKPLQRSMDSLALALHQ